MAVYSGYSCSVQWTVSGQPAPLSQAVLGGEWMLFGLRGEIDDSITDFVLDCREVDRAPAVDTRVDEVVVGRRPRAMKL